ncbi:MAG: ECF-type sigma factor, partial [Pirellulaceae bacterium]|nr:ECF-type sigma factor [Pirellulaceae bacterium]
VFHSFFQRTTNDKIKVEDARSLWNLLVTMTLAKTRSAGRHHKALKRTVDAEAHAESLNYLREGLSQGPSPLEAAVFVESVEQITADLSSRHQEILALRMLGHTHTEIAQQTALSRQTVYRVMQLIEKRILESDDFIS